MATATLTEPVTETERHDDGLFEIVYGIAVEKPMSALATLIAFQLATRLDAFSRQNRLGIVVPEMLFILDAPLNLRRRPDVAFVSAIQWPLDRLPPAKGDWPIAPALAIEIVSPRNVFEELLSKLDEYFEAGVVEVWVVSPEKRVIYVYRSFSQVRILQADDVLSTDLIPGWSAAVGEIVPVIPTETPTGA